MLLDGCHAENDALRASAEQHTLELRSMREERARLWRAINDTAMALGAELADREAERTEKIIAERNIHGGDLREIDKNDRTQKTVSRTDEKRSKKRLLFFL